MALQDAILRLESMGLMDVMLPFALIFVIIYAVSAVVPHFSEEKRLRIVLSTIISLVVVIPHVTNSYPPGMDVVNIINSSIPQVVMLIVGVVLTLILIAATLGRSTVFDAWTGWVRWIALALVALIFLDNINFGYGQGFFGSLTGFGWFSDPDMQALLLIVVVFGLIVYFVTSGDKKNAPDNPSKLKQMRELMDAGYSADDARKVMEK